LKNNLWRVERWKQTRTESSKKWVIHTRAMMWVIQKSLEFERFWRRIWRKRIFKLILRNLIISTQNLRNSERVAYLAYQTVIYRMYIFQNKRHISIHICNISWFKLGAYIDAIYVRSYNDRYIKTYILPIYTYSEPARKRPWKFKFGDHKLPQGIAKCLSKSLIIIIAISQIHILALVFNINQSSIQCSKCRSKNRLVSKIDEKVPFELIWEIVIGP